ncbi:glycosyltransferase [Clostridium baratii]|uniref:glycosyltransferase n=1 Tax=Clostridium baratii TaxID=1561 RepID=UPI00097FB154|nr:glycosyltransferase [Clostridium baratii]
MKEQIIDSRRKFIIKKIQDIKNKIEIENKLIQLEYDSINQLKTEENIENINTNINSKLLKEDTIKSNIKSLVKDIDEENSKNRYLSLRNKLSNKRFFEEIKEKLDEIPVSNGCKYYSRIDKTIGIIADEFLMNSYEGVANFIYITPKNYKEYKNKLDVLLIASAWKGINKEWTGMANPKSNKRSIIYNVIDFYKKTNCKIVFYSKEDPVNYDRFIDIAKRCEFIFTTCKEIIPKYKEDCNTEKIESLTFSVNPNYHNPIGMRKFEKFNEVIFSGSWYEKYPHRIKDMKMMFDGVLKSKLGLKIIDRNYELDLEQHFFPEKYLEHISPSVNHNYLQKLHKLFNWAINFNSIKDSNTMFANRVYELQANGNILISNYSIGVNNLFPNVFLVNNENDVKDIINNFTDEEVYEHQVLGVRRVMSKENAYLRIEELLNKIGIKHKLGDRKVAVIVEELTDNIKKSFYDQSIAHKELILIKNFNEEVLEEYDFIAFFDKNKTYGRYYLEDMLNAFKYTNSDYIVKDSYYDGDTLIDGIEHDYIDNIKDKYRAVFWSKAFTVDALKEMKPNVKVANGYSIDHFEFNNIIKLKNNVNKKYKLSVIIPTYNNGDHLINKCFNSLRRSSMFDDMEIIIVDDGSTDNYTNNIVNYIDEKYSNVKAYYYKDNGSGSASRPRNQGVKMSTTDYITFLDPDNEAVNNGYFKLYNEITTNTYDMVIGNMLKITDKEIMLNYYKTCKSNNDFNEVLNSNKKKYLIDTKFKGMSIQALIVKKEIIEKNNIEQVLGAVGQDTLFFYELLMKCETIKVINETIHIYYAAVEGSTVNNISKKYFEKAYKIEKAKYEFFKREGLLKDYLEKRYEFYFKNWYMAKLAKTKDEDRDECIRIVKDLFNIYIKEFKVKDEKIKEFIFS